MTPEEIIHCFDRAGIVLKVKDGRLLGPKSMHPEDRELIAANKPELITAITQAEHIPCPGEECKETIRLIAGRGWCPAHQMGIQIQPAETAVATHASPVGAATPLRVDG